MDDTHDPFIVVDHRGVLAYVIKVIGAIHRGNAADLQEALLDAMIGTPNRLIVDLADVDAIDPLGIDILVRADHRARVARTELLFRYPSPDLARLLEHNGLESEIDDNRWMLGSTEHPRHPFPSR